MSPADCNDFDHLAELGNKVLHLARRAVKPNTHDVSPSEIGGVSAPQYPHYPQNGPIYDLATYSAISALSAECAATYFLRIVRILRR